MEASTSSKDVQDEGRQDYIRKKIRHIFVSFIDPDNVLDLFHAIDINVLTQRDIDRVRAVTQTRGRGDGAAELLSILPRYQGWYPCLLKVLRHPDVKQQHVADCMEASVNETEPQVLQERGTTTEKRKQENEAETSAKRGRENRLPTCDCGECYIQSHFEEKNLYCCRGLPDHVQARRGTFSCLTLHPYFKNKILKRGALMTEFFGKGIKKPYFAFKKTNNARYAAYQVFANWVYDTPPQEDYDEAPACVVAAVQKGYPHKGKARNNSSRKRRGARN